MPDSHRDITVMEAYALIKQRFFPDVAQAEWDQHTEGNIFKKLCKDTGFPVPIDPVDRREGYFYNTPNSFRLRGFSRTDYMRLVDLLLVGSDRSKVTYIKDGASRGTTPIHIIKREMLDHILEWMNSRFSETKRPQLPSFRKAKASTITTPSGLYPDANGILKQAFCRGLNIDAEKVPEGFVALFQKIYQRSGIPEASHAQGSHSLSKYITLHRLGLPLDTASVGKENSGQAQIINSHIQSVLYIHGRQYIKMHTPMDEQLAEECGHIIARMAPHALRGMPLLPLPANAIELMHWSRVGDIGLKVYSSKPLHPRIASIGKPYIVEVRDKHKIETTGIALPSASVLSDFIKDVSDQSSRLPSPNLSDILRIARVSAFKQVSPER